MHLQTQAALFLDLANQSFILNQLVKQSEHTDLRTENDSIVANILVRDINVQILSMLPYLQPGGPATQLLGYFWWIHVMYCIILIASTQMSGQNC